MKKREHKLIKNFENYKIYVMGDYDKGSYHMKEKE